MPRRRAAFPAPLAACLLATLAAGGCEPSQPRPLPDAAELPLRGTKPLAPLGKVDFTMPDASGRPYDFRAETEGEIALLFFGYTYCPDICPVSMGALAAALDQLDPAARARVEVVFVTVDPERDTPERLGGWLATFDTAFVGVRGTPREIEEALAFYRFPPPERSAEGEVYTVGHPARIYAFTPDGLGRAMYGPETTRQLWLHDLRILTGYPWAAWAAEGAGAAGGEADPGGGAHDAAGRSAGGGGASEPPPALGVAGDVLVLDAYAPAPAGEGGTTALYLTLLNSGTRPDTLVGVASDASARGTLHTMQEEDGMMRMVPLGALPLAPGATAVLAPGRAHGMLEGVAPGRMEPGGTVEVTLTFARGGAVTVPARVVRYRDVGG